MAGPDQRAAKQMRPGECTNQIHPRCLEVTSSRDRYIACTKVASPAGNIFALLPVVSVAKRGR